MNKIILMLAIALISQAGSAQTGIFSAVKMTGGGTTSNVRPRIALNKNNNPVVVWNKASNKSVSFSAWNGIMFATPMMLTPSGLQADVFNWAGQEIASNKDTVYVVYASLIGTESNVFIHKSINGGTSFSDTLRVSNIGTDKARFPTVSINGSGNPVVSFMRMMSTWAMPSYVVTNSMNGGNSFMADADASNNLTGNEVCDCCPATIVCKNNMQAMLFRDNASNARNTIATFSYNNGSSFDSICSPDFNNWVINACPSTGPDGHFGVDSLYTVFSTGALSPMQVFISATNSATLQTGSHQLLSSSVDMQNYPRIAGKNDTIGVVWEQGGKTMFTYSTNGILGLSNAVQVNEIGDVATKPDIEYANGIFHFVWQSNSGMVHYRTYDINGATSVNDISKSELSVFPNPSSDYWHIQSSKVVSFTKISIQNIFGQTILTKALHTNSILNESINNQNWSNGIYFLKLENQEQTISYKLLKHN